MKNQFGFISNPYITEKVLFLNEEQNKVVFKIDRTVNKIELKKAIESIFNVTVEAINTLNVRGKKKRLGKWEGRRADWKKAVVTLKEGDTIEYFEGA
ncbi:MAG: 50S ribosomal protein L23 [Deltaproteobacteria bacterium]|jgi:large subunit ribosomal protein L23|nr:50S ribosomal protein L23 [Deltaproteobacteria bacterium]MBT4089789.1 50S ribosomal protein L23 [Deltaproteobacteria bacterium]MBT4266361.1 50S ribosomal protein L23 [Deltaproteobacteria bacterium]MBT4643955.1 50S ribosomal protein L23 [Deltaproteobacteria bacterium]MBT6502093.1 50S ribosomal protein L23 [Deltaproteobacteria bacterium]